MSETLPIPAEPQPTQLVQFDLKSLEASLRARTEMLAMIRSWLGSLLVEGEDYGKVPGVDKSFLFKPGAEKLAAAVNATYEILRVDEKDVGKGHIEVVTLVRMIEKSGRILGEGIGSCSTLESKYDTGKWVTEAKLPAGVDKDELETRERESTYGRGGTYVQYKIDTNPFDHRNTVRKMSDKRAMIAACLKGLSLSGLFTQDEEAVTPAPAAAPARAAHRPAPRKQAKPLDVMETLKGRISSAADAYCRVKGIAPSERNAMILEATEKLLGKQKPETEEDYSKLAVGIESMLLNNDEAPAELPY